MAEPNLEERIKFLRAKFQILGDDIKSIWEIGIRVKNEDSYLQLFQYAIKDLEIIFKEFLSVNTELTQLYAKHTPALVSVKEVVFLLTVKYYKDDTYRIYYNFRNEEDTLSEHICDVIPNLNQITRLKLNQQDLPIFEGDINSWIFFKTKFLELVYNDESLSRTEKYYLLLGSLKCSALNLIRSIPVSSTNYDMTWDLLVRTYDDPKNLAATYLEKLIDLKNSKTDFSSVSLNKHFLMVSEIIKSFKNLNISDREDFTLFYLAMRGLYSESLRLFELENNEIDRIGCESLLNWLEKQREAMNFQDIFGSNSKTEMFVSRLLTKWKPKKDKSKVIQQKDLSNKNDALIVKNAKEDSIDHGKEFENSCFICNNKHNLKDCPKFLSVSESERLELLKTWQGCRNCLNSHHKTAKCTSKNRCYKCHGVHHTILHSEQYARNRIVSHIISPDSKHFSSEELLSKKSNRLSIVKLNIENSKNLCVSLKFSIDKRIKYNFITANMVEKLGLIINFFNDSSRDFITLKNNVIGQVECSLKIYNNTYKTTALVVSSISENLVALEPSSKRTENTKNSLTKTEDSENPDFLIGSEFLKKFYSTQKQIKDDCLPKKTVRTKPCVTMVSVSAFSVGVHTPGSGRIPRQSKKTHYDAVSLSTLFLRAHPPGSGRLQNCNKKKNLKTFPKSSKGLPNMRKSSGSGSDDKFPSPVPKKEQSNTRSRSNQRYSNKKLDKTKIQCSNKRMKSPKSMGYSQKDEPASHKDSNQKELTNGSSSNRRVKLSKGTNQENEEKNWRPNQREQFSKENSNHRNEREKSCRSNQRKQSSRDNSNHRDGPENSWRSNLKEYSNHKDEREKSWRSTKREQSSRDNSNHRDGQESWRSNLKTQCSRENSNRRDGQENSWRSNLKENSNHKDEREKSWRSNQKERSSRENSNHRDGQENWRSNLKENSNHRDEREKSWRSNQREYSNHRDDRETSWRSNQKERSSKENSKYREEREYSWRSNQREQSSRENSNHRNERETCWRSSQRDHSSRENSNSRDGLGNSWRSNQRVQPKENLTRKERDSVQRERSSRANSTQKDEANRSSGERDQSIGGNTNQREEQANDLRLNKIERFKKEKSNYEDEPAAHGNSSQKLDRQHKGNSTQKVERANRGNSNQRKESTRRNSNQRDFSNSRFQRRSKTNKKVIRFS